MSGLTKNIWTSTITHEDFNRHTEGIQPSNFVEILDTNSNVFLCKISPNGYLIPSNNELTKIVANMIKSIQLPDFGFDANENKRGGYAVKSAGNISLGEINLTSYNDNLGKVYSFWDNLIWGIMHENTIKTYKNKRLFPNEYKFDFIIWKLDRTNSAKNLQYIFKGCWPKNIGGFNLDWDNDNIAPTFNIELSVDTMEFSIFNGIAGAKANNIKMSALLGRLNNRSYPVSDIITKASAATKVDLSNFRNNIDKTYKNINAKAKETIKENKIIKKEINTRFTKLKNNIASKLKSSVNILLLQTVKEFEEKVRSKLPAIIRTLDYRNANNLLNQIYERIEGWTRGELGDYFITQAELREMLANLDNWPPTIYTPTDSKIDEEEFKNILDFIPLTPTNNENLLINALDFEPTIIINNENFTIREIEKGWEPTIFNGGV